MLSSLGEAEVVGEASTGAEAVKAALLVAQGHNNACRAQAIVRTREAGMGQQPRTL